MQSRSSDEDEFEDGDHPSAAKRRATQRACDVCRRRKTKCDGPKTGKGKCSVCMAAKLECTYEKPPRHRYPSKAYVEELEKRLKSMESLLLEMRLGNSSSDTLAEADSLRQTSPLSIIETTSHPSSVPPPLSMSPRGGTTTVTESDGSAEFPGLSRWLAQLKRDPSTPQFHHESASHPAVMDAIGLKHSFVDNQDGDESACSITLDGSPLKRRPEFWQSLPWERQLENPNRSDRFDFPPDDLMPILIDKYFVEIGAQFPVIYRPAFEKAAKERLHFRDKGFAYVLLLVCALGSGFVDDPRVFIDGHPWSSGWKYFHQVQLVSSSILAPPALYDLQACCLASTFLSSSSLPQALWSLIGAGIRRAQDLGLHRKLVYSSKPNVQEEQWKRVFWVLVTMDRFLSMALGRPTAIQSEDIDVDLPLEVDDEYWEHPDLNQAFVQPAGKPSKVSFFVASIKLHHIMSYAMRTIYSIQKTKTPLGLEAEQQMALDSSLNEWVDSVPDHLRWDPKREDITFFDQSAAIWSAHYQIQILVHQPYIQQAGVPSSRAFASLAICTNAARACSRLIEVHHRRKGHGSPVEICSAYQSATILLLNVRGGPPQGLSLDHAKVMEDVHSCMNVLKQSESRWPAAGRFWDMLVGLTVGGDSIMQDYLPADQNKRKRSTGNDSTPHEQAFSYNIPAASGAAEILPLTLDTLQPGDLQVGYGMPDFWPPISSTANDYATYLPATHAAGSSGGPGVFSLPASEDVFSPAEPVPSWWPDLDTSPAGLSSDWGDSRALDLPPELNVLFNPQPSDVLPANQVDATSGQPSWPELLDQSQWDALLKNMSGDGRNAWGPL